MSKHKQRAKAIFLLLEAQFASVPIRGVRPSNRSAHGQARLIGVRNTRTIKVGERVTISHGGRDTFEGMVTENNPASSLIYVDGYAYERYKVQGLDYKSIRQFVVVIAP